MWPQSDPAGKAGSFNLPIVPSPSVCKHFGNPRACLPNRPDFKFTAYHSGGFRQDFFSFSELWSSPLSAEDNEPLCHGGLWE